ncbi:MAG: uncharacterized protein JWN98_2774 [Abditibacteriota bacterium]|nr:uncharacterized protein [Abditibacteriota bacterium]
MLRMIVEGVGFDHRKQTVVVLKDWEGRKLLPIWIGANEAKAIAWELEGIQSPRPGAHDLLLSCIKLSLGRVTRVVINDLQDSTFFATLDIDTPRGLHHIDVRPSDAIAVAVRAKCPVFVDGGAMSALIEVSEAGILHQTDEHSPTDEATEPVASAWNEEPKDQDDIDRFKRLLDDLNSD